MSAIQRGDLYWANLEPVQGHEQGGVHPVLVISHQAFNDRSGTVIVLVITSQPQRARYPLTSPLPPGSLGRESWVKNSQVRTISDRRLGDQLGHVPESEVDHVVGGLLQLIA